MNIVVVKLKIPNIIFSFEIGVHCIYLKVTIALSLSIAIFSTGKRQTSSVGL